MSDRLATALAAVVGAEHVLVDADLLAGYETDWTRRYRGAARCVVRPGDVAQVAAVVRTCAEAGAAIVTQGGNTGLVGGGVPGGGEVLLSLRRLDHVGPVEQNAAQLTAGAGATIAAVQATALAAGMEFAVDWGARDSATVGGAVATNAGGSRVVRFGTMRQQVMGLQAVLATGEVLDDLTGLPKSTMGLHLPSVMCGSEGTLAIITAVRLRLVPHLAHRAAAWISLPTVDAAVGLLPTLRRLSSLDGVEVLLPEAVEAVATEFGLAPPVADGGVAVLVECAAASDPSHELAEVLAGHAGVLAVGAQRDHLSAIRDHVSMAINQRGVPLKLDVAVPVGRLGALVDMARDAAGPAQLYTFGHLAEGNLHLNYLGAGDGAAAITERVLHWVIDVGGAISAEHGIGRAKAAWLERARGAEAVATMLRIKQALDPHGLLNPGVLLP